MMSHNPSQTNDRTREACRSVWQAATAVPGIAIPRELIRLLDGDFKAALYLVQAMIWSAQAPRRYAYRYFRGFTGLGVIDKTVAEWREATNLTEREQERIRKLLSTKGYLSYGMDGFPARMFYCAETERVAKDMRTFADELITEIGAIGAQKMDSQEFFDHNGDDLKPIEFNNFSRLIYLPGLLPLCQGDIGTAMFLSHLMGIHYWRNVTMKVDAWWFRSPSQDIEHMTGLSNYQQTKARRILHEQQVLIERRLGHEAPIEYQLYFRALAAGMAEHCGGEVGALMLPQWQTMPSALQQIGQVVRSAGVRYQLAGHITNGGTGIRARKMAEIIQAEDEERILAFRQRLHDAGPSKESGAVASESHCPAPLPLAVQLTPERADPLETAHRTEPASFAHIGKSESEAIIVPNRNIAVPAPGDAGEFCHTMMTATPFSPVAWGVAGAGASLEKSGEILIKSEGCGHLFKAVSVGAEQANPVTVPPKPALLDPTPPDEQAPCGLPPMVAENSPSSQCSKVAAVPRFFGDLYREDFINIKTTTDTRTTFQAISPDCPQAGVVVTFEISPEQRSLLPEGAGQTGQSVQQQSASPDAGYKAIYSISADLAAETPPTGNPPLVPCPATEAAVPARHWPEKVAWPSFLPEKFKSLLVEMASKAKLGLQAIQTILDEMAYIHGTPRGIGNMIGLFKTLLQRWLEGAFTPAGALIIAEKRQRQQAIALAQAEREREFQARHQQFNAAFSEGTGQTPAVQNLKPDRGRPTPKSDARARIAALQAMLHPKGGEDVCASC